MLPNWFPINMSFFPQQNPSFYSINFESSSFFSWLRFYKELVYILPLFHSVSLISLNDYMLIGNVLLMPLTDLYYMTGWILEYCLHTHVLVHTHLLRHKYIHTPTHISNSSLMCHFLSCLNTCSDIYLEFLCFFKKLCSVLSTKIPLPFQHLSKCRRVKSSQRVLLDFGSRWWHRKLMNSFPLQLHRIIP